MSANFILCASLMLFMHLSATSQPRWKLLPGSPNANGRHDDIYFVHPNLGWVVEGDGQVHRTTDGGETWTLQSNIGQYARCVGFVDSLNGWIGTIGTDAFLVTSDGGFTWTPVADFSGPPPESICGISVVNDSVVYASGAYHGTPRVLKTTNKGITWHSFALDSLAGALVDCRFVTPDSGIVVGSTEGPVCSPLCSWGRALIISTGDGGNTWKVDHIGAREDELCWKISFSGNQTGFISIEAFNTLGPVFFLKTVDGGILWEEKVFLSNWRDEQGIGFVTEKLGWIGGWSGETYETTDGGDTWYQAGPGLNVNRFRFFGDTLGYAAGQRVHKYSTDTSIVAVDDDEQSVPMVHELHQNFPNPFNPSTTWQFSLPDMERVRLSIVDVLGREIAVILDGVWSAGTHLASWNGKNSLGHDVPSGVYFCRMQTSGHILSRKLMLVR